MTKAGQKLIAGAREALDMVRNIKPEDMRPQKIGWAPGGYICRCFRCECTFTGDKRAVNCADCAYSAEEP